jgi:hypothetical protein
MFAHKSSKAALEKNLKKQLSSFWNFHNFEDKCTARCLGNLVCPNKQTGKKQQTTSEELDEV